MTNPMHRDCHGIRWSANSWWRTAEDDHSYDHWTSLQPQPLVSLMSHLIFSSSGLMLAGGLNFWPFGPHLSFLPAALILDFADLGLWISQLRCLQTTAAAARETLASRLHLEKCLEKVKFSQRADPLVTSDLAHCTAKCTACVCV